MGVTILSRVVMTDLIYKVALDWGLEGGEEVRHMDILVTGISGRENST